MNTEKKFSNLKLDKWLLKNIDYLKYSNPTPIQEVIIPKILKGENVIGIANTGTGKTAAFCLPILNHLAIDPCGMFAIILEPSRELAVQVVEKLKVFSAGFNLRISLIIGGVDITDQLLKLDNIPHIIVATPGRLSYMIEQSPYHFGYLDCLKYLVLDEFDQLLNDSIMPDVIRIIDKLPVDRQTLFFSATVNYKIHNEDFFKNFFTNKNPEISDLTQNETTQISINKKITQNVNENNNNILSKNEGEKKEEINLQCEGIQEENKLDLTNNINEDSNTNKNQEILNKKIVKNLTQNYILVPNNTKEHYLINLLLNEYRKKNIIIFVSSCKRCQFIYLFLSLFNLKVSTIHSKMPQKKRFENFDNFKNKKNNILVSTDISGRGLDIQNVDIVLNYDIPRAPQDYIHRVGRTARAGNKGLSVSFVTQYDIDLITAIEDEIQSKMEEKIIEETAILEDLSLVSKAIRVVQMKIYECGFIEKLDVRKERDMKNKINSGKNYSSLNKNKSYNKEKEI